VYIGLVGSACCLTAVVVHCAMQEDSLGSCVKLNGRKPSSDEERFLQRLYDHMKEKQTPIGRIPTLGFQKSNNNNNNNNKAYLYTAPKSRSH